MMTPDLHQLLVRSRDLTRQRFGNVIQLFAPLYLSNECIDTCTYCGFSRTNDIPRKTLTPAEVLGEAMHLHDQGFRQILLVAGEHPRLVSPDYLTDVLRELKPHFASISIEVAPFKKDVYTSLVQAGLDGIVIYQETYQPEAYARYHLAGPKKNFENRLQAPEEAAQAGIRQLGMGVLLGLAPWEEEFASLVAHVQKMNRLYPDVEINISLPRLKPCASGFIIPHPVSDHDFIQMIAQLRTALPEAGIVLSTREPAYLRDALLGFGITRMSAGSSTEPGGYSNPGEALEQFEISDHRSPQEMLAVIRDKSLDPVFKDWEGIQIP